MFITLQMEQTNFIPRLRDLYQVIFCYRRAVAFHKFLSTVYCSERKKFVFDNGRDKIDSCSSE